MFRLIATVRRHRLLWGAVACLCLVASLAAQPSLIEVAAIRENHRPEFDFSKRIEFSPGRLTITNTTVEDLAAFAHGLRNPLTRGHLMTGWPATGVQSRKFDIAAKLTTDARLAREDQQRALLELLTIRFGFRSHVERRRAPVYRLTLERPGVLGPRLRRVAFNCAEISADQAPRDASGKSLCRQGGEVTPEGLNTHGSGDIPQLVWALNLSIADRVIVDGTGLQGFYVWDFRYGTSGNVAGILRDDLGLKLEPATALVDVVVVDAVRMPTPN